MSGGVLMEYIRKHPYANRRVLVGDPLVVAGHMLTPTTSYVTSLKAWSFSTPEM